MVRFVEIDKDHMPEIGKTYIFLMDWYEDVPDDKFEERQVLWDYDGNLNNFTHYMEAVPPLKKRR